jgi:hypothetical protein
MARGHKTGGRQKGTPNKHTRAVKDMILEALDKAGGVEYLLTQAGENPTAFLTLVGKTLPLTADLNVTALDNQEQREAARAEVCEIFGKPYLAVNNGQ